MSVISRHVCAHPVPLNSGSSIEREPQIRSTTVVGVRHAGRVALGSDGQATLGNTVMKHRAQKVRSLFNGKILAGFAGATADAFTLFERFEEKLQQYGGQVTRAAVELAKDWRTDRYLRRLEALLAVASTDKLLLDQRKRRRDRTGRRHCRDRIRGSVCAGRGQSPDEALSQSFRNGNRIRIPGNCGRHLHLHQSEPDHSRTRRRLSPVRQFPALSCPEPGVK